MLLNMHELLPFWKGFFGQLGFSVVLSDATNKRIIRDGAENIIVETCFPMKLAHGHILNLIKKGIKRIFLPSVMNMKKASENAVELLCMSLCPVNSLHGRASIDFESSGVAVHSPVIHLGEGTSWLWTISPDTGRVLGKPEGRSAKPLMCGMQAQERFYGNASEEGSNLLSGLKDDEKAMVIIGRPYNSTDPGANLNINKKLMELGVIPIPLDMLTLPDDSESEQGLEDMYWGYGQKILRAAKFVRNHDNLYAIYVTNFGCGPDSFITHFFKKTMKGKPYLQLEIDEHSADAGARHQTGGFSRQHQECEV